MGGVVAVKTLPWIHAFAIFVGEGILGKPPSPKIIGTKLKDQPIESKPPSNCLANSPPRCEHIAPLRPAYNSGMDQLQALYDSEINFQISAFHDEGFTWKLGDELNGFKTQGKARTIRIAVLDLINAVLRTYPESEFSELHRGPMN